MAAVVIVLLTQDGRAPQGAPASTDTEVSSQAKRSRAFVPTTERNGPRSAWSRSRAMTFRAEHVTEGKISINEDRATPIFRPMPAA